ncbi:hypothetical protein TTHERM_00289360 (macronuclear) [Tetrahymena thermophila SB210]|uniref:RING-type domain-containing protein n=1 Tax=Tetrahymena thermophila (strain SB210) TaxID=312017 RepID=I7M236_TETTS|nr:hypothetical protein TTHERM_00289360 [Tetrahymena thermophila SB210]EAR98408.1 hypothetical protein TTHERM_00289360 [Tetrahymena thermophila SB210]|eukprot:XP_001018653.1 hypothetical protein TTHERM_00289360 [Tetrahymena thermophila SB210]
MILNQGYALIDRLCNKQEVCQECHQTLQAVKECIVMNECGHMIHETCFRSLQSKKNFCCKSCKGKIKIAFILNQIQVVQIISDGRNIISKRKKEFESKINEYFFSKIELVDKLQEKLAEKEQEIQNLNEKLRLMNADTQRDTHNFPIENNSSTNSNSFQNIPNPHFTDKSEILNTVKVKDKLKFYTDLAGLSPQQNIFSDEKQNKNERNNKMTEQDINQMSTRLYSQFQQKYKADDDDQQQKQNTVFIDKQKLNSQNNFIQKNDHHLKFSFGSKREINSDSPERDMIVSVDQPNNQNLEEMKTILYTQDQINQIKQLSNQQNSQNSGLKKNQKLNGDYIHEDIFSFAKQKQTNSNLTNSNCSAFSQNSSLLRGRIRTSNSDYKNSLSNKKLIKEQSQINSSLFSYESPQKSQQNFLFNQENPKNVNSPINTKIFNSSNSSGYKLSESRIKDKCTSCSKERHSHPNSDSKLTIESSPDKKKRFTADFRLQSLSQARQKLNFFNLQPIQQNNSDNKNKNIIQANNQTECNLIKNQIQENNAQSTNQLNYQQTIQKTNIDLDQTIIGNINDAVKSQLNSQSQNSQDSATQPSVQKITFNKNARRPHPDQNLIQQQNVCLKMPKYVTKN